MKNGRYKGRTQHFPGWGRGSAENITPTGQQSMAQKASPKKSAKKAPVKKTPVSRTGKKTEPAKKAAKGKVEPKPEIKSAKKPASVAIAPKAPEPVKETKKEKVPQLSKQDLAYFRNLLLEKRREIIGDVGSMESEAYKGGSNLSNMPIHMADVGTDNFEQEFTLGLIESERQILRDIQEALVRVDNGTFGVCLGTGKPIPKVRLEAVPWAKYTIEYSRLLESGKISQDSGSSDDESGGGDEDEE
jgi:DnaK suppressor protein